MKTSILTLLAIALLFGSATTFAADKAEKPAAKSEARKKKPAPELSSVTISGKVSKKETKGKDGKIYKYYSVNTSDGKVVRLTKSALGKKSKVNLEELVGAEVKVTGKGYETGEGKKKRVVIKKIETIEKAGEAV